MNIKLLFGIILLLFVSEAYSATWYVDGTQGNDKNSCTKQTASCKTLATALAKSSASDEILVAKGHYQLSDCQLLIRHGVSIKGGYDANFTEPARSEDANDTVFQVLADDHCRFAQIQSASGQWVDLQTLSIQGASNKGAMMAKAGVWLRLDNVLMQKNQQGALRIKGGKDSRLEINNSRFEQNQNTEQGGALAVLAKAVVKIERSRFINNRAASAGAIYAKAGQWQIINSTLSDNQAGSHGAGLLNVAAHMQLLNVTVVENKNQAAKQGAGLALTTKKAHMTLDSSIVSSNVGGGAPDNIYLAKGAQLIDKGYNIIGSEKGAAIFDASQQVIEFSKIFTHKGVNNQNTSKQTEGYDCH